MELVKSIYEKQRSFYGLPLWDDVQYKQHEKININEKPFANVENSLLSNGKKRNKMLVYSDVEYTDKKGKVWTAPAFQIVDGASIPKFAFSFTGGPLDGNYLLASIIHDWYCVVRTEDDKAVHDVFKEIMLHCGVPKIRARYMHRAVLVGGPKWKV